MRRALAVGGVSSEAKSTQKIELHVRDARPIHTSFYEPGIRTPNGQGWS